MITQKNPNVVINNDSDDISDGNSDDDDNKDCDARHHREGK